MFKQTRSTYSFGPFRLDVAAQLLLRDGQAGREHDLAMLKIDPLMDRLRDDPRFASLLERLAFGNTANREILESASDGRPG